jgi:beta-glucosidase-like glycosyl hydrolase
MAKPENKPTLRDLRAAKAFLQEDVGADQAQLEAFRSAAAGVFPRATAFRSSEQNKEQQAAIAESRRKEKAAGNEDAESGPM